MIEPIHPGLILIIGVLFFPLIKNQRLKQVYLLGLPLFALLNIYFMPEGTYWTYRLMDYPVTLGRVDLLSKVFGYVFSIIAFCAMLYALHLKEKGQHVAAFIYAGSALGVVFSGDFISLYVFWEIMAVASSVLIFSQKTKTAVGAGMRYLMVHATGGIFLLGGIIMYMNYTGSHVFDTIDFGLPGAPFILIGFIINAAVPPLHAWLADAYPEATITGAVFLTAFTTKSAVYVLLRGFSGLEILMWLGAIMAVYGVILALLQNDIRRLLSYHIISQVGYMVAGVGMGTILATNGSAAHAFSHILYKALLFMGAGAVIYVTGKRKFTELGGLYKVMPLPFLLYMVGAFSISGVPLFNGFISKTMVVAASGELHNTIIYAMLVGAGVGTFLCIGLKIPYYVFFGKDKGFRPKKLPGNMMLAMGITAFMCILIGVYPTILYNILPNHVEFVPYTASHVVDEMQLLLFTTLAFFMFSKYLKKGDYTALDTDWVYRKAGSGFMWFISGPLARASASTLTPFLKLKDFLVWFSRNPKRVFFLWVNILEYRMLGRIHGLSPEESLDFINTRKMTYPGKPIHRDPVGDAVIVTLFFLFIYVAYYLL